MRIYTASEIEKERGDTGFLILIYGPTGVGKTVSCMQTADDPILYVICEKRDPRKFLREAARPGLDIDFVFYDTFDEAIEFFSDIKNFDRYKTVIVDSITFLSLGLSQEITEEGYYALDKKKEIDKPLTMRTKLSMEGYGALGSQLLRLTNMIGILTQNGKDVVLIALLEENPSYKREFNAAPLLEGKKFGKNLPGFCDMIGMVETRLDDDGNVLYPPRVLFDGDEWFMHKKYSNISAGPLDLGKILKNARSEKTNTNKKVKGE